ncbi:Uncharacterised protein [Mycobacteroides abscessus]|nr:Uncharacterised protein [Mycobacteroides abscessus]
MSTSSSRFSPSSWNEYILPWFHSPKIALPSQYSGHLTSESSSGS